MNRSAISQPIDRGRAKAAIARLATTRPAIINGARPNRSERRPAGYWPMNCATRFAPTMMPQSARRRAFLVDGTIRAGFDLHQPFGVEQAAHPDERGHRLDGAKDFAVRPTNLAPAARHGGEDPGTCHIVEAGPHS